MSENAENNTDEKEPCEMVPVECRVNFSQAVAEWAPPFAQLLWCLLQCHIPSHQVVPTWSRLSPGNVAE
ncbi:hypothetical protein P7K49_004543 [Saguinus oedipus]|uniref:Uncharacterized protein n=1 Tax=Saguinus oedipus TaxID=9490 RepID=A0ABQ9W7Q6_SAGOE|nr:hypothetical protein P7K49_004543 [Saguinus oedipus]